MPSDTLLQLLATPIEDDVEQQLLSDLNSADFPITDWASGAVMKTLVKMVTRGIYTLVAKLIPVITAGGFLTEADATWLRTMLAPQLYNLTPQAATFTIQQATLTCDANNGPYTIVAGKLIALTTAGRRYTNITGGSLPTSATLTLQWQSEGPNDSTNDATNYIDGANSMTSLVTPMAGVSINNPALDYTPTTLAGVGPNMLVTASRTDPATSPRAGTILIQIIVPGQMGDGNSAFLYRRIGFGSDSDSDFRSGGNIVASFVVPATGTSLTFVNDGIANPSFAAGSLFAVSSPGGPIITQGRDLETVPALIARCQARWPDLSAVPTPGKYKLWAFAADPQVTKVGVSPDPFTPLQTNVTIGGQVNPLGGSVTANVQQYLDSRLGATEKALVTTATARAVSVLGFITVPVGTTADVQAATDAAWQSYIAALDVGGVAKVSELQRILGDAVKSVAGSGARYDTKNLTIKNANAQSPPIVPGDPFVNLQASPSEVIAIAATPSTNGLPSQTLTWYEA